MSGGTGYATAEGRRSVLVMADNRQLRHGEKRMAMFTSEKGRDRASAQRSIEGLTQNDQIINLLVQQNALLAEQSQMLKYLCDMAHHLATGASGATGDPAERSGG